MQGGDFACSIPYIFPLDFHYLNSADCSLIALKGRKEGREFAGHLLWSDPANYDD